MSIRAICSTACAMAKCRRRAKANRWPPTRSRRFPAWIEAGADWPAERVLSTFEFTTKERAGRDWWSLVPPVRPEVPTPARADRVRTPIDAFVWARLEAAGLEPAAEADRATLIRRAMFDVWGLPPDPAEVDAFVADSDPQAYERLIDRLLASPHYGERRAQHWLDVVRFAESNGFETNSRAANGLALPRLRHSGAQRRHSLSAVHSRAIGRRPWSTLRCGDGLSGGRSVRRRQQPRRGIDAAAAASGFGRHDFDHRPDASSAMTIGCAKCHDHKFDVISQRDYYALQAMVAGVKHGERDIELERTPEQQREVERSATAVWRCSKGNCAALGRVASRWPGSMCRWPMPAALRRPVQATGNIERFGPIAARRIRFTVLTTNNLEPCLDELEIFAADDGRNVALATAGAMATASSVFQNGSFALHQLAHINDGHYGNDRSWISAEPGAGWIEIQLPESVVIDRVEWARDRNKVLYRSACRCAIGSKWPSSRTSGRRWPRAMIGASSRRKIRRPRPRLD